MLEKIGLPPKPSLRGNIWVVDASHCQGCSSQFTFINRKHHCRRCGGIFCGSCTRQRMVLGGQGDSPVRICEPCKKLEEAARFELRHGRRPGRGSLKSARRDEDEVLNQVLGQTSEKVPSAQRSVGVASSSSSSNYEGDLQKNVSNDMPNVLGIDLGSTTPDELRKLALEEKKKHRLLKGEGKSDEALRAFKRGKELERQAGALEIQLRKARKKSLPSGNLSDVLNRDVPAESGRKTKSLSHVSKQKDDLTSELKELGWSDMDLHSDDKKSSTLSLEGELSSIIGEICTKTGEKNGSKIDKSQVVALKKKALMLKREGKLAEAKEELKKAKILDKELEEQELLAEAEDSDDELSALIRGMDYDKELPNMHDHRDGFDFEHLLAISDNIDGNFEVTDEDMMDPDIAVALESFGWTEPENTSSKSQSFDKEELLSEIQSLKRQALNKKRAGNTDEAMAFLKKAKLLERGLNSSGPEDYNTMPQTSTAARKSAISEIAGNESDSIQLDERNTSVSNNVASTVAPKSRLMIQRELLSLKKKALMLRREGKMNEAEEEMQKGAALERQLMEMDKASNLKTSRTNTTVNVLHTAYKHADLSRNLPLEEGSEDDVTDQDMSDPTYLSLLRDLGWNDDNNDLSNSPSNPSKKDDNHFVPVNDDSLNKRSTNILVQAPRSKAQIQRELLGLKRKALAFRREGKVDDAEEVLKMAKALETQIAEMEAATHKAQIEANVMKDGLFNPPVDEERDMVVLEEDMHDPTLNSMLTSLGWKDDESEPVTIKEERVKEATGRSTHTMDLSADDSSSGVPATTLRSMGEIQRELLALKRKALAFRRKGEIEEAEEILRQAKTLEAQLEDFGNQDKDLSLNVSKDEQSVMSESSDFQERQGSLEVAREVDNASASSVVWSSKNISESTFGLERIKNNTNIPILEKSDNLIPATSHIGDGKHSLSAEGSTSSENVSKKMKAEKTIGHSSSSGHSMDVLDLLTGDGCNSSETVTQKHDNKLGPANLSQSGSAIHLYSSADFNQDQGYKNNDAQVTYAIEKPNTNVSYTVQDYASQQHLTLPQEILARKRKAVSLKREGKLMEAKEELRRAKLLEKGLEDESVQPDTASVNNVSHASNAVQKKQESSNVSAKPLSSRDRFKLQQESLGHKRQALKLRREGRIEEAENLFERAKAIETQLEELTAQDSNKSDAVDDVTVEDFLDPQLLSALKAVGLDDVRVVSKVPERQETVKSNAKIENSNQERIQLEERVKEEKLKALNLKRSGKQAEALDALRRAKLYEKKLNSLTSG